MQITNVHIIEHFKRVHANAGKPIKEWADKTTAVTWKTPMDIKRIFASASFVKQFVIFNIGGNKYRLLTKVIYEKEIVRILKIGTHEDYNGWRL
jgi:mRNA interferase HigB